MDVTTNTMYTIVQNIPVCNVNRQRVILNMAIIAPMVSSKVMEVNGSAVLCIGMELAAIVAKPNPLVTITTNVLRSHGRPKQNRMSNIFDPIELQMAILARPAFFTIK